MGKVKTQNLAKKNNGILKLEVEVEKLQKSLSHSEKWDPRNWRFGSGQETVPEDVKEGCFAMIAAGDDEEKRFVVPLAYLDRPSFQRLLERSADEYGFSHDGALMVPCRPSELELMLANRQTVGFLCWNSCKTIVESYWVWFRSTEVCQMKAS